MKKARKTIVYDTYCDECKQKITDHVHTILTFKDGEDKHFCHYKKCAEKWQEKEVLKLKKKNKVKV